VPSAAVDPAADAPKGARAARSSRASRTSPRSGPGATVSRGPT